MQLYHLDSAQSQHESQICVTICTGWFTRHPWSVWFVSLLSHETGLHKGRSVGARQIIEERGSQKERCLYISSGCTFPLYEHVCSTWPFSAVMRGQHKSAHFLWTALSGSATSCPCWKRTKHNSVIFRLKLLSKSGALTRMNADLELAIVTNKSRAWVCLNSDAVLYIRVPSSKLILFVLLLLIMYLHHTGTSRSYWFSFLKFLDCRRLPCFPLKGIVLQKW